MFKESFPKYFKTSEDNQIFFKTNFDLKKYDKSENLLVFNYGLVCNEAHWKFQLKHFDSLGYQILIHDYRGHFNSSGIGDIQKVTFLNMTRDLFELLSSFEARNILMLGHSMGVNISLEFAKTHPEMLDALVLISGTVLPPQDVMFNSNMMNIISPLQKEIMKNFPKMYKTLWKNAFLNPFVRKIVYHGGFNTEKVPESFVETYIKRIGELQPEIFIKLLDEMRSHNILAHLDEIKTKALVIAGEQDKVIPLKVQRIVHENLPHSEIYIIKNGSHVPQVDFPNEINERIELLLSEL